MIGLIFAVALLQAGDPCHAIPQGDTNRSCPQWRQLSHSDRLDYFVNPASLTRSGGTFEISVRVVLPAALPRGTRSAVVRRRFDCARRTSAQIHTTTFDTAGAVMADGDTSPEDGADTPASPGTPLDALLTEYCPR